jgi:hypothetical protein
MECAHDVSLFDRLITKIESMITQMDKLTHEINDGYAGGAVEGYTDATLTAIHQTQKNVHLLFPKFAFQINELDFWVTGMNPLWPKLEPQDGSPVVRSLQVGYAYVPSFKNNFKISTQSFPTKKRNICLKEFFWPS